MRKVRYTIPLLPLRGISVFPGMIMHFDVGRPKSIYAVKEAMNLDKMIFLCYQNDISVENPTENDLAFMGTIAEIHQILNLPDGNLRILVEGIYRGKITKLKYLEKYTEVSVIRKDDILSPDEIESEVLTRKAMHLVEEYLELYDRISPEAISSLLSVEDPGELADVIASNLPFKPKDKQIILDILDANERLKTLINILTEEIGILSIEKKITTKVNKNLDDNQREYVLRERLRVIHEELGDETDAASDIKKYRKRLSELTVSKELTEKLEDEFNHLTKLGSASQEYAVIQNYIETVLALPWGIKTDDVFDVSAAQKILERDHYGLDKVKERILEYIAVRAMGGAPKSNIICLVGPPGTGKTSIAAALSEALNRKYVRISLGGVKNEAEIRGHRKTYIGAMPGRIIEALKKCGSSNPLMLFDEIDKMSKDISGDPASAMLEVFDPEQNKSFRDNFLELPFDLSDTIFIATANTLDTIPLPLLDRMDIIEVDGYTFQEKIEIAKRYLIPKQRKLHGLSASRLKFSPSAYCELINNFTRESGVRSLERKIAAICRKTAKKIVLNEISSLTVTKSLLKTLLPDSYIDNEALDKTDKIGVVTGLAWTQAGGDTLCVEANIMAGTGKLELTGNLGDVMQESAKIALSYIRANSFALGIDDSSFKNRDIHIHVPEGAVPKDGPSAGITIATAIYSALSGCRIRHDVAMTGEITLTGRVLPIGGLKEKTLAALRDGAKTVIIPERNKCDFENLPDVVKENIRFVFAKNIADVFKTAVIPKIDSSKSVARSKNAYGGAVNENIVSGLNIN